MTQEDIDTAFQSALESGKVNGAILCATDSKDQFSYLKLLGHRTTLSGERLKHELGDILFLASATKLIATIAALSCVEDGLISLTDDLSKIAPELVVKQVLAGFEEDGTPILEAQEQPITMEMLLTHSSGLSYHFLDPRLMRLRQQKPSSDVDPIGKKPVEGMFQDPLAFQPGQGWMYGGGIDWAGRIVERLTKKTLLEHLHTRIFTTLGITDAKFYPVTQEDLRARMVDLNPNDPEGTGLAVIGGDGTLNLTTKGDFGGHGLFMTAGDYLKVLRSLLANDEKMLKKETVEDMFTTHLSPASALALEQILQGPLGPFMRVGTEPGSEAAYGLGGLLTTEDVEGWYGDRTLTWGGGLTFTWFVDRKNDLCGLCALQSNLPVDVQLTAELKQVFRKGIYRKKAESNS